LSTLVLYLFDLISPSGGGDCVAVWHGMMAGLQERARDWEYPSGGLRDDQGHALAGFSLFHSVAASYIYYFMLLEQKR
jgi:hypothetical protein